MAVTKKKKHSKKEKLEKKCYKLRLKLEKVFLDLAKLEKSDENVATESEECTNYGYLFKGEFSKIRKKSFKILMEAVAKNVEIKPPDQNYDVEKISLMLEQKALLACMLGPVYEKILYETVCSIEAATNNREQYWMIAESLSKSNKNLTDFNESQPEPEFKGSGSSSCFTQSYEMPQKPEKDDTMVGKPIPVILTSSAFAPMETTPLIAKIIPIIPDVASPAFRDDSLKLDKPVSRVPPRSKSKSILPTNSFNEVLEVPNLTPLSDNADVEPGLADFICHMADSPETETRPTDHVDRRASTEDDFKFLMQILNDSEAMEDFSHTKRTLDRRINQMEDLFGYENENDDAKETESVSLDEKPEETATVHPSPCSMIKLWRNERYIFLYKILTACKRMSPKRFFNTRRQFSSYFGDDSDYEQEELFDNEEKFLGCCARRILPVVVKYIMPYYKQRRICNGSYIFKNLVRRIADSLVDLNYYPCEGDVQRFVEKFFPPGKKYMDVKDVWCFAPEED